MKRAALLAFLAIVLIACSEPLEFADWTIPVPEGTRIVEYAAVSIEERTEQIELVEDLVVGGDPDNPQHAFYRVSRMAVDGDGNMYILDSGNHRVQVFDSDGEYVRTLGSEGQGPGELSRPRSILIAGDKVVVIDGATARSNFWSLDGEYLGAAPTERSLTASGFADGSMVGSYSVFYREPVFRIERAFAHVSAEGVELGRYALLPMPPEASVAIPVSGPGFASTPDGHVYIHQADQYQALALNASGEHRWALRTNWPTPPVQQEVFETAIERMRERQPDYEAPWEQWPDNMPAIGWINVDGRGNLYVFPYVFVPRDPWTALPLGEAPEAVPVDVYSPEGDVLFMGMMSAGAGRWRAALGEHVYSTRNDPETDEQVVVRYRLVTPFQ